MVATIQYPHVLEVTFKATDSVKDANGNWIPGNIETKLENIRCRVEPNSKGAYEKGEDGKQIEFSSLIYIEGRIETIPLGSEIKVYEGNELILTTSSLKFSRDSFHCRLWV